MAVNIIYQGLISRYSGRLHLASAAAVRGRADGSASPTGWAQSSARAVPPPHGALSLALMALMWSDG